MFIHITGGAPGRAEEFQRPFPTVTSPGVATATLGPRLPRSWSPSANTAKAVQPEKEKLMQTFLEVAWRRCLERSVQTHSKLGYVRFVWVKIQWIASVFSFQRSARWTNDLLPWLETWYRGTSEMRPTSHILTWVPPSYHFYSLSIVFLFYFPHTVGGSPQTVEMCFAVTRLCCWHTRLFWAAVESKAEGSCACTNMDPPKIIVTS